MNVTVIGRRVQEVKESAGSRRQARHHDPTWWADFAAQRSCTHASGMVDSRSERETEEMVSSLSFKLYFSFQFISVSKC
jgi:hypothetical protein